MRHTWWIAAVLLGVRALYGCGSPPKPAEAEAAYLSLQLVCIDEAATKQEADACRKRVQDDWAKRGAK